MDAELADRRIDRRHFGGEIGRDLHALARREDIEFIRIEDEPLVAPSDDRLPEFAGRVGARPVDVDHLAVLDRAVADDLARRPVKTDAEDQTVANVRLVIDQRDFGVARAQLLVRQRKIGEAFVLRITAAEADLIELRSFAHPHAERARRNLGIERTAIAEWNVVESLALIDNEPGENIEPSRRTFRIGRAGKTRQKIEPFDQRRDIDDAFLQHRAIAGQRDALRLEAVEMLQYAAAAAGQEACAHAIGFLAETKIETRGLELTLLDSLRGQDQLAPDHRPDLLARKQAVRRHEIGVVRRRLDGVEQLGFGAARVHRGWPSPPHLCLAGASPLPRGEGGR